MTGQPGLFPETVPTGPDPLANHIVQDPGFVEVDPGEVRRQRLAAVRKSSVADSTAAGGALDKFAVEMTDARDARKAGYLGATTLFSFEGRINRKKYWLSALLFHALLFFALFAIGGVLFVIAIALSVDVSVPGRANPRGSILPFVIFLFFVVVVGGFSTWVSLALHVKRYHDLGKSGLWVLIAFIPLGVIWTTIECGFFPGQTGKNQYGPDPLKELNR